MALITAQNITDTRRVLLALIAVNRDSSNVRSGDASVAQAADHVDKALTYLNAGVLTQDIP